MLFKGSFVTAASGKAGGVIASHNASGQYLRQFTVPTNPQTAFQLTVRNAMSALVSRWANTLTAAQRAAWSVYATNVSSTNALGDQINYSGINWYCACNVPRVQSGLSVIDTCPGVYNLATLSPPVATIVAAGTTASIAFTNTDAWANEVGGALLIYSSRPQSPAINFFKNPYRYAGKISGAASPPTSPFVTPTLPFPIGPAGSKMFFKFVAVRADGRISSPFRTVSSA